MIKISYYQTTKEAMAKVFSNLAEKCYYSNLRVNVFTSNQEDTENLDKTLWTYSKKHFIPHAACYDPLPEKQPIYITHELRSSIESEIIIFVNLSLEDLREISLQNSIFQSKITQKILFIFDETEKIHSIGVKDFLEKNLLVDFSFNSFFHTINGKWEEKLCYS